MFALYLKIVQAWRFLFLFIVAIVSQIQGFCLQSIWIWQFLGKFVKICKNSYYLGHIYVVIYSESSNNTCDIDICVKLSTVKTCVWTGSCQNGKIFLKFAFFILLIPSIFAISLIFQVPAAPFQMRDWGCVFSLQ